MMDDWQKSLHERLVEFIGDTGEFTESKNPISLSINIKEAYVLIKALEAQEKFENPMMIVEKKDDM